LVVLVAIIDNTTARLTRGAVVLTTMSIGVSLVGANLVILTIYGLGGMA
jgi:hypothetical protein